MTPTDEEILEAYREEYVREDHGSYPKHATIDDVILATVRRFIPSHVGPSEPPMVYDPNQGEMVAPGQRGELVARLRQLFDKTADAHDGDYAEKVSHAIVAVYAYGRRQTTPSTTPRINHMTQLVRQAIFHVLDDRAWDFENDEHRVDFADAVATWIPMERT